MSDKQSIESKILLTPMQATKVLGVGKNEIYKNYVIQKDSRLLKLVLSIT